MHPVPGRSAGIVGACISRRGPVNRSTDRAIAARIVSRVRSVMADRPCRPSSRRIPSPLLRIDHANGLSQSARRDEPTLLRCFRRDRQSRSNRFNPNRLESWSIAKPGRPHGILKIQRCKIQRCKIQRCKIQRCKIQRCKIQKNGIGKPSSRLEFLHLECLNLASNSPSSSRLEFLHLECLNLASNSPHDTILFNPIRC